MKQKIILGTLLPLLFACGNKPKPSDNPLLPSYVDTFQGTVPVNAPIDTLPKTPVFGYRFVVPGDFDGDGAQETLVEHYFSLLTGKETEKFYENMEYGDLVDTAVRKLPFSFMLSTDTRIDTLYVGREGQLLGVAYLKNEGDLNGDGGDEIGLVTHWADWSNLNTYHIYTYRKGKWDALYSFDIWDWQLPDLPGAVNDYGLFGLQGKYINAHNDSVNRLMEQELQAFPGLVRKIKTNKIRVYFRNEESMEDSMVVNLKNR